MKQWGDHLIDLPLLCVDARIFWGGFPISLGHLIKSGWHLALFFCIRLRGTPSGFQSAASLEHFVFCTQEQATLRQRHLSYAMRPSFLCNSAFATRIHKYLYPRLHLAKLYLYLKIKMNVILSIHDICVEVSCSVAWKWSQRTTHGFVSPLHSLRMFQESDSGVQALKQQVPLLTGQPINP